MKVSSLMTNVTIGVLALSAVSCLNRPQQSVDPALGQTTTVNPYGVPVTSNVGAYPTSPNTPYPAADTQYPAADYQPASAPVTASPATGQSHTVVRGDTLWGISQRYGTTVGALQGANNISGTTIVPGQSIVIP